jgi:uncharacterized protein (DUF2141 family)
MQNRWQKLLPGIAGIAFSLICAPCFGGQAGAGTAHTDGGFRIAGVIVSARTGEPLGQARVMLANTKNRREAISMITQEGGRFEFTGLVAGKYALQGARRGYIPAAYEQHEQFSTAIVTGKEFDTENLTLRLVPMASLTGTVIDENGEGVRDAQLRLYVESHRGGSTRVVTASSARTDDRGTFEFAPIGPGKYYVSASARPWYAENAPFSQGGNDANRTAAVNGSLDVAYPMTFYGGSTESEGAEAITVAGGDHAEIEIHLSPVQALHLTFHVPDNGQHGYQMPVFQRRVFDSLEFVPAGNTQNSSSADVVEIGGIPAGRYSVLLPGNGSGEAEQASEVNLSQNGQSLDEVQGEPLGRVKLTVKIPDGQDTPKQVNIGLQDKQNKIVAFSQVKANGEAIFERLSPGSYGIRVFAPTKAYSVMEMTSAEAQVSGHEFSLKAGESQEWSVSLAEGRTRIEGFVKRGDKSASGVMVVLVPSEPNTHQDMFRRDQSDSDGSFTLPDVIPGTYTVVAIEDAWGFDWSKPTLLSHYAEHGQTLTIGKLMQGVVSLPDAVEVQPR